MRPARELFPSCKDTGCMHLEKPDAPDTCVDLECYVYTSVAGWCENQGLHGECQGFTFGGDACQCPCHRTSKYYVPGFADMCAKWKPNPVIGKLCTCSSRDIFSFGCRCGGI